MSDDSEQRVAELEARLAALAEEVAALRARGAAGGRASSLKRDVTCPACGGQRVLHAAEILDRGSSGRERLALMQPSAWSERGVGEFEAYVCMACGFSELYIKNVHELPLGDSRLRVIEGGGGAAGSTPYR
ncbi:MAG: hypothetical protein U0271_14535 [Polyangiaceae bacterium]